MILNRRKFVKMVGLGGAALGNLGQSTLAGADGIRIGGHAFGGTWTILLDHSSDAQALQRRVEQILNRVDNAMSPYITSSEISRFNAMSADQTLKTNHDFNHVTQAALNIARLTKGAFDPTVGPKVNALGFGPIVGSKNADWRSIVMDGTYLGKTDSEVTLDLCGIAKGYALELVRDNLFKNGVRNAFIEIGGEITTIGRHPGGREWRVAIESPKYGSSQAIAIVTPKSLSIATSGHRANGVVGPIVTSHIVPKSGEHAIDGGILSVSVLAKSAMLADALATALCAMKATQAVLFASESGIDALFALETHNGFRLSSTGRFSAYEIG